MESEVEIPGAAPLNGRFFSAKSPRAVAVLNGATAVPHRFYHPFARWLASQQQVSCLTYDYRDFGASLHGHSRDARARMGDWGIDDTLAARRWAKAEHPDLPLWIIGHSLGGLLLPYQPEQDQIDRIIGVCSGPVHSSDHPFPYRLGVLALWHLLGPMAHLLTGYIPGRVSGLGSDLPSSVFWQWRRWCTTQGFEASDPSLPRPDPSGLRCPLRTVALSDDTSVPPAIAHKLAQRYPHCPHQPVELRPADFGLKKVGHVAAFAERNAALWPQIIG